ncbi:MAG: hypothetical protein K0Q73_4039 [Paenibacillus sp.]|jgi:hypothetical protein|nr:hypothetical protein [Paenibacillus sp.]
MANGREVINLLNRAGLWETRSKQAALRGDYDRAGRLRTKALQLAEKARFSKLFQKKMNSQVGLVPEEHNLFFEARNELRSTVLNSLYPLRSWSKALLAGSVHFGQHGTKRFYNITSSVKLWSFHYDSVGKEIMFDFQNDTAHETTYLPLEEKSLIEEMKSLLVLSHYMDLINLRQISAAKHFQPLRELLTNMYDSFPYDYQEFQIELFSRLDQKRTD